MIGVNVFIQILVLLALFFYEGFAFAAPGRDASPERDSGSFIQVNSSRSRSADPSEREASESEAALRRIREAGSRWAEPDAPVEVMRPGRTAQGGWRAARKARGQSELVESDVSSSSESSLRSSLNSFVNEFGEPSDKSILYIIVADGHGDLGARRQVLEQAVEMKNELGYQKIVLIDLGDRSNGSDIEEIREMDRLARDFGIEIQDHWGIPGNMERRGQGELTIVHERQWWEQVQQVMSENTTLLTVRDSEGHERVVSDDEMIELPLSFEEALLDSSGNPMIVLAGHKPETLLPTGRRQEEQLVQRAPLFLFPLKYLGIPFVWRFLPVPNPLAHSDIPYTINYRNWLGVPVVAMTVTLPSWFLGVPFSPLINFRLYPKTLVPDFWRPFGTSLQLAWDIIRLKPLMRDRNRQHLRWSSFFRKSGPWWGSDERDLETKLRERLLSIPRIDPETAFTMRRETPVPEGTAVVLSGHTHRPGFIRKLMKTEDGHYAEVLVVEVPPSFDDPHVPYGASGWVSLVKDASGNLRVLMHDKNQGGAIVFNDLAEAPTRVGRQAKVDSRYGKAHVFSCQRMMSEMNGAKGRLVDRFRKFGNALARP